MDMSSGNLTAHAWLLGGNSNPAGRRGHQLHSVWGAMGQGQDRQGQRGLTMQTTPRPHGKSVEPADSGPVVKEEWIGKTRATEWLISFAPISSTNIHEVRCPYQAWGSHSALCACACRMPSSVRAGRGTPAALSSDWPSCSLGNAIATPGRLPSNSPLSSFLPQAQATIL